MLINSIIDKNLASLMKRPKMLCHTFLPS